MLEQDSHGYSALNTSTDTSRYLCALVTDLNIPDGACGVNARGTQPLWIGLVPIKGRQGSTELAVLVLHQNSTSRQQC